MNISRFLRLSFGVPLATLSFLPFALAIAPDELATLRAKAEAGNGIAQYNLGLIYANRQEALVDPREAFVWLKLAADNGATGKALMLVTTQMTPTQLEEAKTLLDQRRAQLMAKRGGVSLVTPVVASTPSPVSPVSSAGPINPISAPSSPIVASPVENESPVSAAEQKKLSLELAAAWKENDQLKADLARAGQATGALEQLKRERDQLASTLSGVNQELAKLRAAAANFEGERNGLQQKVAEAAQSQRDGLAAELAAANARTKSAENELSRAVSVSHDSAAAKEAVASLTSQVTLLTAENQRLLAARQAAAAVSEKLVASQKELATARGDVEKLQTQLAEASAKSAASAATVAELAKLRQGNEILTAQLQKLTADRNRDVDAAAQFAQQQQKDLLAQLEGARTQAKTAEEARVKGETERAHLDQQLAAAKSVAATPSADLSRLTGELNEAKARLTLSEEALSKSNVERDHLTQQTLVADSSAQQQLTRANTELTDTRSRLAASQEALAKLNAERSQLAQQLAAAQARPDLSSDLAQNKEKLQLTEAALASAHAERSELARRLAVSAAAPAAATVVPAAEGSEVAKQLEETQAKLTVSLRSYQLQQIEIDRLQKALANIDAERASLTDRIRASVTQASAATAQAAANGEAAAQLSSVREQLRQTQNQSASLAMENSQLKNRLSLQSSPPAAAVAVPTRPAKAPAPAVAQSGPSTAVTPTAPARPTATAVPVTPDVRIHTVASGDTLSKISKRYYGTSERWAEIVEANRDTLRDPGALTIGAKLKIP